ncbi:MAG: MarR family winged helix-turn-helix transcriptional regulator, partial [Clostridiales bacterium]|nr:MarR family winged helix-turn-helix transcriptional regulator [Clostridiales bacterium]
GLIRVEREDDDRRKKKLFLTSKGAELGARMDDYMKQLDEMAFAGIPEEEQEQFMRTLSCIYQNLKGVEENGKE